MVGASPLPPPADGRQVTIAVRTAAVDFSLYAGVTSGQGSADLLASLEALAQRVTTEM